MANANTLLNRVYVQTIDSTGTNDPTLRLGTKTLTTTVQVGGVGTVNSINVSSTGINVSGPLKASSLTLTNASMERLDVTGLTNLQNVSVKGVLDVVGQTKMGNVSTTALTATTFFATTINATGLSTLNNVSVKGDASVDGKLWANDLQTPFMNTTTTATIKDATITGTLGVTGKTTLGVGGLEVNGATEFKNTVALSGTNSLTVGGTVITNTIEGSGSASDMDIGKGITTGKINIGEVQTGGSLNIGQKVGRTGNINIGTELAGDGAINIGTNITGSGAISIGTAAKTTTINGIVNATGLTGFAKTGLANTFDALQTMTGGLTVTGTVTADGLTGFAKTGANANTFSSIQTMNGGITVAGATNINTTGIEGTTIGNSGTTTNINGIVNAAGLTGFAKTGSNANTFNSLQTMNGGITVAGPTNINITGSTDTTIGNSGTTTNINGIVNATGLTGFAKTGTANTFSDLQTMNGGIKTNAISTTSGTSQLLIAHDARSYGGDIVIGGGGLTGNSGIQTAGIRIGDGLNGIHSYIQVGSTTMENIYLATKSTGSLFLNYGDNGNIYLGKSSSSGKIYMGKPLGLNYTTVPTFTSDQIGYSVKTNMTSGTVIPHTASNPPSVILGKTDNLPIGIWLISWFLTTSGEGGGTVQYYIITNATATNILTEGGSSNAIVGLGFIAGTGYNTATGSIVYKSESASNSYAFWTQTQSNANVNKVYAGHLQFTRIG